MKREIWKVLLDRPQYSVSDCGRVKRNGRLITSTLAGRGYPWVSHMYVHTLVLENFVCIRPRGCVANHKDGNKCNNRVENLEWVTPSQNWRHAIALGLRNYDDIRGPKNHLYGVSVNDPRHPMFGKSGEKNPAAKLTQFQAEEIRRRRQNETLVALAKAFGVSRYTIMAISLGRSYR